ncbi:TPA: hypothetical protein ACNVTV_004829 [Citrobacter freundii]
MASTITRQPMTAHQLVHAIHALSRSHLYTLKAVECLPEKEQEAAAEKVVSELRAFIDQCLPKVERVELLAEKLHPRDRDAQYIRNIATAALPFASLFNTTSVSLCELQRTEEYRLLQDAITAVIDDELVIPHPRNTAATEAKCKPREYTTPYGHKLSQLSKLARTVADAVEDDGGRTYKLHEVTEHKSLCMLIDMLVDAGVLPLNSVKKVDGITLSQLQQLLGSAITVNSPAITVSAPAVTLTGRLTTAGD